MSRNKYEGTSKHGDITEALNNAIGKFLCNVWNDYLPSQHERDFIT